MLNSLSTPVNIKIFDNYFHWRTQSEQLFLIQLQKKFVFLGFKESLGFFPIEIGVSKTGQKRCNASKASSGFSAEYAKPKNLFCFKVS